MKSDHEFVVGMRVDTTSFDQVVSDVLDWAKDSQSRYVCVANVHMAMEAHDKPDFREVVNQADIVTPDGMPLVWMLRRLGHPSQKRVNGPELMIRLCEAAARDNIAVGLLGAKEEVLDELKVKLTARIPELNIAYAYSPPFRELTVDENQAIAEEIKGSGAKILFVGLGCPKQERWMASQRGKLPAVMLGVGAAFDIHAGRTQEAPRWMQRAGLEWLYRLVSEPKRLWKRYFLHNPRFIAFALWQLAFKRKRRSEP